MKAFSYKLRPTKPQRATLGATLETCRRLYNGLLAERKDAWENEKRAIGFAAQCASLPARKASSDYFPAVHSQVLQNVVHRLDRSFANFFRRVKNGETAGSPRFKGRGRYDSFCYPQWGNGATFSDGRLALSKIGSVRVCTDRPLEGTPKTCTIVRRADGWYAHVVCETKAAALSATGKAVAVDVGISHFATLSTGETIANPRHYRTVERQLKKAHRRLSRRVKGSQRRAKARILLAKAHLKVKRQRLDFAHKTALALVGRFDTIVVEDLNIRGMLKNHALAKHIQVAGWGLFRQVLTDKAANAGRYVVAVNPAGTSQQCSECGNVVPKRLACRWHSCPYCGCEMDRDHNAASNILTRGGTAFGEPLPLGVALNREPHRL